MRLFVGDAQGCGAIDINSPVRVTAADGRAVFELEAGEGNNWTVDVQNGLIQLTQGTRSVMLSKTVVSVENVEAGKS